MSLTKDDSEVLIHPEYHDLFHGEVSGSTLTATYYVNCRELSLDSAAEHIAATISCGLGVAPQYFKEARMRDKCYPKISDIAPSGENPKAGHIKLVIPLNEMVNGKRYLDITQVLNFVYGDFFVERQITRVKLIDLDFSAKALDFFKGPSWGIDRIREAIDTSRERPPHIGVVPHPPLGMDAETYAQQCYQLALAGVDHIVDSDVLVDPTYCSIEDRVALVTKSIEEAGEETDRAAMYSVNITSDVGKLLENADKAVGACGKNDLIALGICVANTGLSALRTLREYAEQKGKPIHAHVTGLPLMTRYRTFGTNYRAFNSLVRLLGADIVHAGSLTGRYLLVLEDLSIDEHDIGPVNFLPSRFEKTFREKSHALESERNAQEARMSNDVLSSRIFKKSLGEKIRTAFPLIAGGITPANLEYHVRLFGNDIILLAGSGLFREVAQSKRNLEMVQSNIRALRQVLDIIMNNENVLGVLDDPKKRSKFKDLFKFADRHGKEFKKWVWEDQPPALRGLDRFKPRTIKR